MRVGSHSGLLRFARNDGFLPSTSTARQAKKTDSVFHKVLLKRCLSKPSPDGQKGKQNVIESQPLKG
jgi:hypothetical protein